MSDQERFINHIANNYEHIKKKYYNYCKQNQVEWDEDVFQSTILKCFEAIEKKGKLIDSSPQGCENYFFMSFKVTIRREKQYASNAKRDRNVDSNSLEELYENYMLTNATSSKQKLINDLFQDFAVLYILHAVEENFDNESYYLFRTKYLTPEMTYKKLAEITKMKKVRMKVITVKKWIKENITKQEIKDEFFNIYGSLL